MQSERLSGDPRKNQYTDTNSQASISRNPVQSLNKIVGHLTVAVPKDLAKGILLMNGSLLLFLFSYTVSITQVPLWINPLLCTKISRHSTKNNTIENLVKQMRIKQLVEITTEQQWQPTASVTFLVHIRKFPKKQTRPTTILSLNDNKVGVVCPPQ